MKLPALPAPTLVVVSVTVIVEPAVADAGPVSVEIRRSGPTFTCFDRVLFVVSISAMPRVSLALAMML